MRNEDVAAGGAGRAEVRLQWETGRHSDLFSWLHREGEGLGELRVEARI